MIHLTTLDALTLEHNLRTNKANRYGWLQPTTSGTRRPGRFSAALNVLVTFIPGKKFSRKIEPVSASDTAVPAATQPQGVM